MATVASLWVGGPLTKVQEVSLASFVYYKHTIYLYVYDMNLSVPPGVIKLDANEIMPESDIFYHWGQLAGFSDLFRYKMIMDTGMMWVDADTLCLGEYFFEDKEIVFINENNYTIAGGILKLPSDSGYAKHLYESAQGIVENLNNDSHWTAIGPKLLDDFVKDRSLEHYAIPSSKTNVFQDAREASLCWVPRYRSLMLKKMNGAVCATFFNGGLTMINFDKNNIPDRSLIGVLYKRFLG